MAINLGKSRQTNAVILNRITSEFNTDFTNFAPLKLNELDTLTVIIAANVCFVTLTRQKFAIIAANVSIWVTTTP